jgi:hypothetical protein
LRPDGIIIVENGSETWSALVETKVGSSQLEREQIEAYLDIAKANNINAIITVSNQFVILPNSCPIQINKQKAKNLCLFHFSWTSIVTEALLLSSNKTVADPDQAYILNELLRYLQHENSGVMSLRRMDSNWKEVCIKFQQDVKLTKQSDEILKTIISWHQLIRFLSLEMSIAVMRPVTLHISRNQKQNYEALIQEDILSLLKDGKLKAAFNIPGAASNIRLLADLKRKVISASMHIEAPKDRVKPSACINWLIRQIEHCEDDSIIIRAYWPGRTPETYSSLGELKEDRKKLLSPTSSLPPVSFDVKKIHDIENKFMGVTTFVEEIEKVLPYFYDRIGKHLKAWEPLPPKVFTSKPDEVLEGRPEAIVEDKSGFVAPTESIIMPPMIIQQPLGSVENIAAPEIVPREQVTAET